MRAGLNLVPCSTCPGNPPKFLKGFVVWSSKDKRLRIIGNCCARDFFGEASFDKLKIEYKKRMRHIQQIDWLAATLPLVDKLRDELFGLSPAAEKIQFKKRTFQDGAPTAFSYLQSVFLKNDGVLRVERQIRKVNITPTSSDEKDEYEIVLEKVAEITGGTFTISSFMPASQLSQISNALAKLQFFTNEDIKDYLLTVQPEQIENIYKTLVQQIRAGIALSKKLRHAASFINPRNLRAIQSWSQHENCRFAMRIDLRDSDVTFLMSDERAYFKLDCPDVPSLDKWNELLP